MYTLVARLATGGTGEVWLATAPDPRAHPGRIVVKTILPHLAADRHFAEEFAAQARTAAVLHHPNIVPVLEVIENDEGCGVAMEFVGGRTLRELLVTLERNSQTMPSWLAVRLGIHVSRALSYAHGLCDESGRPTPVLHGDLAPENIMLGEDGELKVLDFGVGWVEPSLAATPAPLRGRYAYMAPERLRARPGDGQRDPRSDIYSLGIVLFEMLTGRRPQGEADDLSLVRSALEAEAPLPRPSDICPWIVPELDVIVLRALARDPGERFATAADLEQALCEVADTAVPLTPDASLAAWLRLVSVISLEEIAATRSGFVPISALESAAPPDTRSSRPPATVRAGPQTNGKIPVSKRSDRPSATMRASPQSDGKIPVSKRSDRPSRATTERPSASLRKARAADVFNHDWDKALDQARQNTERNQTASGNYPVSRTRPGREKRMAPEQQLSPNERANLEYERGMDLLKRGDEAGAMAALENALQLDPNHRLCRVNLNLLKRRCEAAK